MTLDATLVSQVDRAAKRLGVTRSAFTRRALAELLDRLRRRDLEEQYRQGYSRMPVKRGEFGRWRREQVWPD